MFTVVIPLYNKELNIRNTLLSVLNQSYQNFEIVIINDGSTDDSVKVVNSIQDNRIRLIHQENQGVSAARNRGIKESKYQWVAFLDGDDLWENNHLEEINKMMEVFPNKKVYVTSFEYSDKRKKFKHKRDNSVFPIQNYFQEALQEILIWTSVTVVHKSCFSSIGYFNENLNRGEDLDLWARLSKKFTIIKSEKSTALYNLQDTHSLTKSRSIYTKSILSIIDLKDKTGFERIYFKRMIMNRLKADLKNFEIKEFFKIVFKHNIELLR